ncbi:transcriptional regulator [Nocardia sp. NBC_00881]|uniref:ParB/RepB/Spo0J family partition protein n=1 Tax=Nocardia sp. NBC_00881 TaxID=2975995 RepID=UPI003869746C|nr:transcriptional regulator [Nocardia sp. NBC_00881]
MDYVSLVIEPPVPGELCDRAAVRQGLLSGIAEVAVERVRMSETVRLGGVNPRHVALLAQLPGPLPPIVVHRATMEVIDGVHRLMVARRRQAASINAVFFDGEPREAFVLAVELNSARGLPLSLTDRKAAAVRMLADFPGWSNRRLGEVAGLSDKTVAALRRRSGAEIPHPTMRRIGRDGAVYPVDARERRRRAREFLEANPAASTREIALAAGVSPTTAKDVRRRLRAEDSAMPKHRQDGGATTARACPSGLLAGSAPVQVSRPGTPAFAESPDLTIRMRRLRADPSLRFTEVGRKLLRLLEISGTESVEWQSMADSLPMHCAPAVAELARHYAENWLMLADSLSRRLVTDT